MMGQVRKASCVREHPVSFGPIYTYRNVGSLAGVRYKEGQYRITVDVWTNRKTDCSELLEISRLNVTHLSGLSRRAMEDMYRRNSSACW